MASPKVVASSLHRTQDGVATNEVPSIIVSLAAQVKMTPIAWHIEPTYVVIVFEQGPKLRFDRLPDDHPGKPVFATKDDVTGHITKIANLAERSEGPNPASRGAVKGKTHTTRRRPIGKKLSK